MSKCGDGHVRVLQMIACPDPGWRAVFADDSKAGYFIEPVACWLLVEHQSTHGTETHVHPAAPLGTVVSDATEAQNYLGVISPKDNPEEFVAVVTQAMKKTA